MKPSCGRQEEGQFGIEPLSFWLCLFSFVQLSIYKSLTPSHSYSLPLTHWRMLTHQVPWHPSMGWCHFRWHHHAVCACACVCAVCISTCSTPPTPHHLTPPFTHTRSVLHPAALLLSLEERCCLIHGRYTHHQPNYKSPGQGEWDRNGRE